MTDKKFPDLSDVDWDKALDEWEENTFVPEVARDRQTNRPAPRIAEETPEPVAASSDDDEQGSATVVARIPKELLRGAGSPRAGAPSASSPPKSQRGGLGQLFGKSEKAPEPTADDGAIDVPMDSAMKIPAQRPRYETFSDMDAEENSVVTSAKSGDGVLGAPRTVPRLPTPVPPAVHAPDADLQPVAADEAFDPFGASAVADEVVASPGVVGARQAPDGTSGPALLSPGERHYDPNDDTGILDKKEIRESLAGLSAAGASRDDDDDDELTQVRRHARPDDDDEVPTRMHRKGSDREAETMEAPAAPRPIDGGAAYVWVGERTAQAWLRPAMAQAFAQKAAMLEDEARGSEDSQRRARALLAASELRAILGERERATALAREALEAAPELPLAHRQARALTLPHLGGEHALEAAAMLEAEARAAGAGVARAHAELLAADALRTAGHDDAAARRLDAATHAAARDPRGHTTRASRALARGELTSASLRVPEGDLPELAAAVAAALRARGVERDPVPPQHVAVEHLRRARIELARGDLAAAAAAIGALSVVPELAGGAAWAQATLGAVRPETRRAAADALRGLAAGGDRTAARELAARGLELGERAFVDVALANGDLPAPARAVLEVLATGLRERDDTGEGASVSEGTLEALRAEGATFAPLVAALAAISPVTAKDGTAREQLAARHAIRVAGEPGARAAARLARLAARGGSAAEFEDAARAVAREGGARGRTIALEAAVRAGDARTVANALEGWAAGDEPGNVAWKRHLAAALIAERCGDALRAREAYAAARLAMPSDIGALRALAALTPDLDLGAELDVVADELGGDDAAITRLEGAARRAPPPISRAAILAALAAGPRESTTSEGDTSADVDALLATDVDRPAVSTDDVDTLMRDGPPSDVHDGGEARGDEERPTNTHPRSSRRDAASFALLRAARARSEHVSRLALAHEAAPDLGLAAFLAELSARAMADHEEELRWLAVRAGASPDDPYGTALARVREARLLGPLDPAAAAERLDEARRARPDDVALADLSERLAEAPPEARASARERRAERATAGETRTHLLTLAAYDYERSGFLDAALRTADRAAEAPEGALAAVLRDRAAIATGRSPEHEEEPLGPVDPEETTADANAASLARLRRAEHAMITEGARAELEPVAESIARTLAFADPAEAAAHAELAVRLRASVRGDWAGTRELAELAAELPSPTLAALRLRAAHARASGDDAAYLAATLALVPRVSRPQEAAVLCVRAGEAAARLGELEQARDLLERARTIDAGDVVTWGMLADVCQRLGDARGAAEACESLARTSAVPEHQLLAWYDAGRIWLDDVGDTDRGIAALEYAVALDVSFQDTYERLAAVYKERGLASELAHLLDRRIAFVTDPEERVGMEVERARALADVGFYEAARSALAAALEARPDRPDALAAFGDLCARQDDWDAAEQAWVRLARLLQTPDEQRDIYARLGELYLNRAPNLARAEVAFREVLKRAPEEVPTRENLVEVYRRMNDVGRALEVQHELVSLAHDPAARRQRLVEVAQLHETVGHDVRRAEQTLENARREMPTDVVVLRALAELHQRGGQRAAVQVLLDRAAGDARRAFAQGRFTTAHFEVLATVHDIRGRKDASAAVEAVLAAYEGHSSTLRGADTRAADSKLDELLAPESCTAALRGLLARAGGALDAGAPLDARALAASSLPPTLASAGLALRHLASAFGLGAVNVLVSPRLGCVCVPAVAQPATVVIGEPLLSAPNELARDFLFVRALKLLKANAAAMARVDAREIGPLIAAWLSALSPSWKLPEDLNAAAVAEIRRRVAPALPKDIDPELGSMALEVIGAARGQATAPAFAELARGVRAWATRTAALAIGDPSAALDAIAYAEGLAGAPKGIRERAEWIATSDEAKDLVVFLVSDAYADARVRSGLAPEVAPPPLPSRASRTSIV